MSDLNEFKLSRMENDIQEIKADLKQLLMDYTERKIKKNFWHSFFKNYAAIKDSIIVVLIVIIMIVDSNKISTFFHKFF